MKQRGNALALSITVAMAAAVLGCSSGSSDPGPAVAHPGGTAPVAGDPLTPRPSGGAAGAGKPAASVPGQPVAPHRPAAGGAGGATGGSRPSGAGAAPPPANTDTTDPSCTPGTLLRATTALLDGATGGVPIDRIDIFGCGNAYARVIAVASNAEPLANGQVFLHRVGADWRLAARTSPGLDCGDEGLTANVAAACSALAR
ncbi:hypothetical protein [Micromonospora sp. AMSO31t]|uniref:hypothetical protein n=1 Tax=Micromonospora sp. AMSO31t TaxID=2650566 RepID=UPI00124B19A1|nr:hypothetical protein [Micromonospora sp. AMSO31t]KAB1916111.1 hypothetical protein F8274_01230 [Micromonospora sp. AMSO31t]